MEFDAATGRLRLDVGEFAALAGRARRGSAPAPELVAAGAWTDEGPHPVLALGLDAVRSSSCQLRIRVTGPAGAQTHEAWLGEDAAAFLLHVREQERDFVTVAPPFVPVTVARVLRLGPRKRATAGFGGVSVAADHLIGVLAAEPDTRVAAMSRLLDSLPEACSPWAGEAGEGRWRAGHAESRWVGAAGSPDGYAFAFLDSPGGVLMVGQTTDDGSVTLEPVTASAIFRRIVGLLPYDDEITAKAAG